MKSVDFWDDLEVSCFFLILYQIGLIYSGFDFSVGRQWRPGHQLGLQCVGLRSSWRTPCGRVQGCAV